MIEQNPETFGSSLIHSITSDNLKDLVLESGEIALDSILEEGLAKNIPFFQLYKIVTTIRDRVLLKKIYAFLFEHKDIGLTERVKFLSQFETGKEQREFGETVILLLDRVIHVKKAQIIGRLSRAYLLGRIDQDTFFILSDSADRVFLPDLPVLLEAYTGNEYDPNITQQKQLSHERLDNAGLMYWAAGTTVATHGIARKINDYGRKFVEIALLEETT